MLAPPPLGHDGASTTLRRGAHRALDGLVLRRERPGELYVKPLALPAPGVECHQRLTADAEQCERAPAELLQRAGENRDAVVVGLGGPRGPDSLVYAARLRELNLHPIVVYRAHDPSREHLR